MGLFGGNKSKTTSQYYDKRVAGQDNAIVNTGNQSISTKITNVGVGQDSLNFLKGSLSEIMTFGDNLINTSESNNKAMTDSFKLMLAGNNEANSTELYSLMKPVLWIAGGFAGFYLLKQMGVL